MKDRLQGKRVAVLAASGVEQVELTEPRRAVEEAGASTQLLAVQPGQIQAVNQDIHLGDTFRVDGVVGDANVGDYDALLLPGGAVNPDTLRQDPAAVAFVREF
ncbi:MAG: DJ-1/PfpI family protein, partial [bacterium]|nr:DJ-1/PfpI family protein [bacterium]